MVGIHIVADHHNTRCSSGGIVTIDSFFLSHLYSLILYCALLPFLPC